MASTCSTETYWLKPFVQSLQCIMYTSFALTNFRASWIDCLTALYLHLVYSSKCGVQGIPHALSEWRKLIYLFFCYYDDNSFSGDVDKQ